MKAAAFNTIICNLLLATAAPAGTPSWLPPPDSARCPSKWGAGDERGAGNHMKPLEGAECGHQIALVVNGVHFLENLKLDELAAKNASKFAFMMQPLKVHGVTGSTVVPATLR